MKKVVYATTFLMSLFLLKSINAHEIKFTRLSNDSSSPLFSAVMIGVPKSKYSAFIFDNSDSCSIIIFDSGTSKKIIGFTDYTTCSKSSDEEDGYSFLNASRYKAILENNPHIIKTMLTRYNIDHGKSVLESNLLFEPKSKNEIDCVLINKYSICAGKDLFLKKQM